MTRAISRVDTVLKVVQVRSSPPEGLVQVYLIQIADKSEANFRKVLDIKGVKGRDASSIIELFHAHKSAYDSLVEANPLMTTLSAPPPIAAPTIIAAGPGGLGISPALSGKFDAATFGSALISGMKEGVDRLGTPVIASAGGSTGTNSPGASVVQLNNAADAALKDGVAGLNENLQKFGRFFRSNRFGSDGK